jgi:dipeptidyl aminopeptidase/acylaminoacyl peptidase
MRASFPQMGGDPHLSWASGDRLLFLYEADNWEHLYSVPASGGAARRLTAGNFMIEDLALTHDLTHVVYEANTGSDAGDFDRRHLFDLNLATGSIAQIVAGKSSEWNPVIAGETVGFIDATASQPPLVAIAKLGGGSERQLDADRVPADFPSASLVTPVSVSFRADDGTLVHAQIFSKSGGAARKPAVIFVHGGPPRQMMSTWHYMDYYSNGYAVNQYLADHGFVVLALNYRLSIGYGHDYHYPAHWGPTGASEYGDVLAAARYLQKQPNVDPSRLGIWGGSYGGYLTALALARNSNIFKTGVDFHGVHDWSLPDGIWFDKGPERYQTIDRKAALKEAWESSPDSAIATWRSPVLLIQGDDDRNVDFHQMVDLVQRLRIANKPYEEIVIPNEIHGFLRYASWIEADSATVEYLTRQLHP